MFTYDFQRYQGKQLASCDLSEILVCVRDVVYSNRLDGCIAFLIPFLMDVALVPGCISDQIREIKMMISHIRVKLPLNHASRATAEQVEQLVENLLAQVLWNYVYNFDYYGQSVWLSPKVLQTHVSCSFSALIIYHFVY